MRKSFRKIEEAVAEKYKVEVSKRGAHRRGEPWKWRIVQRVKKYQHPMWNDDCCARIFSWFREYDLQRKKGVKESQTEKEDVRQQQKGEGHDRYDNKNQIRRQSGRKQQLVGQ